MDANRQKAYRSLLYRAMLEIRVLQYQTRSYHRFLTLFPLSPRKHRRIVRASEVAEWLHNMADFSVRDFQDFDEVRFWKEADRLQQRYPGLYDYRREFEAFLFNQEHGHWPTSDELSAAFPGRTTGAEQ